MNGKKEGKLLITVLLSLSMSIGSGTYQSVHADIDIIESDSAFGELRDVIREGNDSVINLYGNIFRNNQSGREDLGTINSALKTLTIKGNQAWLKGYENLSMYDGPITVAIKDQTLNIEDLQQSHFNRFIDVTAGKVNITSTGMNAETGKSLSYFHDNDNTVIRNSNQGEVVISDSDFENNTNVIENNGGKVSISGSTFNQNGDAIINNQNGTLNIEESVFENNTGNAVTNAGEATITDSSFSSNATAISNSSNINIAAVGNSVSFSGNTTAISNTGTVNLNADETYGITFDDAISGENGVININDAVKITDSTGVETDAPTAGTIHFNDTVEGNSVNLYNGTIKFGESGSFGEGTTLNNGGFETNLGSEVVLNNDLNLVIDAIGDNADVITGGDYTSLNNSNIILSEINFGDNTKFEGTIAKGNIADAIKVTE